MEDSQRHALERRKGEVVGLKLQRLSGRAATTTVTIAVGSSGLSGCRVIGAARTSVWPQQRTRSMAPDVSWPPASKRRRGDASEEQVGLRGD